MAVFTTVSKNRLSWSAPAVTLADSNYFLDVGSGFELLIGSSYRLIIQPGGSRTTWTPITKSQYV